jgi:hypothetical protein
MNYRSIADLSNTITRNLHRLPRDVDLIVGVPPSGILAAAITALSLIVRFTRRPQFASGGPIEIAVRTRPTGNLRRQDAAGGRILRSLAASCRATAGTMPHRNRLCDVDTPDRDGRRSL